MRRQCEVMKQVKSSRDADSRLMRQKHEQMKRLVTTLQRAMQQKDISPNNLLLFLHKVSLSLPLPGSLSPSLPDSLSPSLPDSLSPSLPDSLSPSLPDSLSPSLPDSLSPSLPDSLSPSLPDSLSPSLPDSLSPSLPDSLSPSLPDSLSPSLPDSLSPSLPHSLAVFIFNYSAVVFLFYYIFSIKLVILYLTGTKMPVNVFKIVFWISLILLSQHKQVMSQLHIARTSNRQLSGHWGGGGGGGS